MKKLNRAASITCLFLDIGGVLLTNGWDHLERRRAATQFKLDLSEMEGRHRLNFELHERGKLSFNDYLNRVVFFQKRSFTRSQFFRFMCSLSQPFADMIQLISRLKARHRLKIVVVSNESRELNAFRLRKFNLGRFVDLFISSCFVQLRKPDVQMFRLAVDVAQVPVQQVVYIDNTPLFIQVAEEFGIRGIQHTDCNSTRAKLALLGLQD